MKTLSCVALCALLLVSCGTADAGIELQRNLLKWQAQNITHYKFDVQVVCLCLYARETVEVKNGKPVSIVDINGKALFTLDENGKVVFQVREGGSDELVKFLESPTIENLFTYASASMFQPQSVSIDYDPKLGYPAAIGVTYDANTVRTDNGEGVSIANFEILP